MVAAGEWPAPEEWIDELRAAADDESVGAGAPY
jgi:hypothetical protein